MNNEDFKTKLIFNIEKDGLFSKNRLIKKYQNHDINLRDLVRMIKNYQILKYGKVLYLHETGNLASGNTKEKFRCNNLKNRRNHAILIAEKQKLERFLERV